VKKPKSLEEVFDEMFASRDEPVSQTVNHTLQTIFATTHSLMWLRLDSPSFLTFPPTSGNLVATGFKSRSAFPVASQQVHPLYNSQIDAHRFPEQSLLILPIFTRDNCGLAVVQFSRKPDKIPVNHEVRMASFPVNKFHTYGGFLFLNAPSIRASIEATHFGEMSFVIIRSLRH
jgi:hypothetical protein